MRIAVVNYVWAEGMAAPEQVFERFPTLTGWAGSVAAAGGDVNVYQRFPENARVDRSGVGYVMVADDGPAKLSIWSAGADDLHALVASERPDIVHVNGVLHPRRVRRLRALLPAGSALVVQDHGGFDPAAASTIVRAWVRGGLSSADMFIVAAAEQEREWRESGIVPAALPMFDVMESGTRLVPIPRPEAQERSGVSGEPALLWVGRLTPNKDPLSVLAGVEAFVSRCPGARLTMVYGSAELERDVRRMVDASPRLGPRVRLAGKVPHEDLAAYYSAADILVSGSRHEGSGYAVIEGLACGATPVITDIPPFRALADGGRVGALWPPGRPDALADALMDAARRVGPAQRDACRALFDARFSWPAIGRRAMDVYERVRRARRPSETAP